MLKNGKTYQKPVIYFYRQEVPLYISVHNDYFCIRDEFQ
jgi:hypothetical protein